VIVFVVFFVVSDCFVCVSLFATHSCSFFVFFVLLSDSWFVAVVSVLLFVLFCVCVCLLFCRSCSLFFFCFVACFVCFVDGCFEICRGQWNLEGEGPLCGCLAREVTLKFEDVSSDWGGEGPLSGQGIQVDFFPKRCVYPVKGCSQHAGCGFYGLASPLADLRAMALTRLCTLQNQILSSSLPL